MRLLLHPRITPIMPEQTSSPMTVTQADQRLQSFDCTHPRTATDLSDDDLRQGLQLLAQHSDFRIFGICADSVQQGYQTLVQYTTALGGDFNAPCPQHHGPVYIKFNTKTGLFHVDAYVGQHRGVLVSCQSAYEDGINNLYGHFPLDLFAQISLPGSRI